MVNINKVGALSYDQNDAAIDGSKVVWVQKTATGTTAIYYKNMASGVTSRVYQSKLNQTKPDISGTKIVWEQTISTTKKAIYYKNLANGTVSRVYTSKSDQSGPKISGNMVVWAESHIIRYKNIVSGTNGKIISLKPKIELGIPLSASSPAIDGNNVVWLYGGTDYYGSIDFTIWYQVQYKNLKTGNQTGLAEFYNGIQGTDISGNNVVFMQANSIYVQNLITGVLSKVQPSKRDQGSARISGTRVVWTQETSNGHIAICVKNLANGNSGFVQVTTSNQMRPNISGTKIVWTQKMANGHLAIYYKNIVTGYCTKVTP